MKRPIAIVRSLIRAHSTLLNLLGSRIYPVDDVPENARRPYIQLACTSDRKDEPLEGIGNLAGNQYERHASVDLLIVGNTETSVNQVLEQLEQAIGGKSGTDALWALIDSDVEDLADQADGPVDLDDGDGFVATGTVNLIYRRL